jgi:hypothetical protein
MVVVGSRYFLTMTFLCCVQKDPPLWSGFTLVVLSGAVSADEIYALKYIFGHISYP